jgi:HSP20 family molecular chaperone IbpA
MQLGPATRTVEIMRSPSPTLDELRRDLEHLVMDLFEGDRRGAIPALDVDRQDGQLVVYARLPGSDDSEAPMGVEVRLPCAAAPCAA